MIPRFATLSVFALGLSLAGTSVSRAAFVIDDFETYATNQVISGNFSSGQPWVRFGAAFADDMAVTSPANALSGLHSATTPVNYVGGTQAIFRRNLAATTDFTAETTATAVFASPSLTPSSVQLVFAAADGATYQTRVALQILPGTPQTLAFLLNGVAMERTEAGTGGFGVTFAQSLATVTSIGFRYTNVNAGAAGESIRIDDFVTVPEPAAMTGLALAGAAMLRRRRSSVA